MATGVLVVMELFSSFIVVMDTKTYTCGKVAENLIYTDIHTNEYK